MCNPPYIENVKQIDEDMEKPLIDLMNKYLEGANYRFHKDIYDKMRFLYIIK